MIVACQPLTIGQVASAADVNVQTIRSYERRGLVTAPRRAPSGYRQYADDAVAATHLARALDSPVGQAEALLRASGLSPFVYADEEGRVVGFWGLSTARTHHRFTLDSQTLRTWCAEDSLFLPELLGETARVESQDPESGELVQLTMSPRDVESAAPEGVVVSVNSPEVWEVSSAARIMATACHFIFFFSSRASGERWVVKHPQTVLLSLAEAFTLGKRQNARWFGAELARRPSAAR